MQELLSLVGDKKNDIPSHVRGAILNSVHSKAPSQHPVIFRNDDLVKWPTSCRTSIIGPLGFVRSVYVVSFHTVLDSADPNRSMFTAEFQHSKSYEPVRSQNYLELG
jgi:hypothetical protein